MERMLKDLNRRKRASECAQKVKEQEEKDEVLSALLSFANPRCKDCK